MHEKNILIKTYDGNLDSRLFLFNIRRSTPWVIFYMDAPGIREELREMCRRISKNGYNVMLPNLFYRKGTEGKYPFNQKKYKENKKELKKMIDTMNNTSNSMILDDTKYLLNYIKSNFKNNKIGIVGYCMSGRFVVSAGAKYADQISAIASFYGVGIYTKEDDSPHLLANRIKGELYLAFAEKDIWVPQDTLDKIKESFSNYKCTNKIEIYSGTDHGFAFPERSTYLKDAAEKHWLRLFDLFKRNLLQN